MGGVGIPPLYARGLKYISHDVSADILIAFNFFALNKD